MVIKKRTLHSTTPSISPFPLYHSPHAPNPRKRREGERERAREREKTYETQHRHRQRRDGMHQGAPALHLHPTGRTHQIPSEIPGRHGLHRARGGRIPIHPLAPPPRLPVPVDRQDVEGGGVDEHRLQQGHAVHVPIPLAAPRQRRVGVREEPARQVGGQLRVGEVVEQEEGQDFVHVLW